VKAHLPQTVFVFVLFGCFCLGGCHQGSPSAGAAIFKKNCAGCHRAGSTQAFAPSLAGYLIKNGEAKTRRIVRQGTGNMPRFGRRLGRRELDDLMAYLRNL
jgi:mono/diheme cytochrome c family protein